MIQHYIENYSKSWFFSFAELTVEVMLISLMSSYNLWSLKQSPYLFMYYLFIYFPFLGKLKCEAIVADVLDKGSGLIMLMDGNSFLVLIIILLDS